MGFDWDEAANGNPQRAENMPEGYHRAKIAKVITGKGDEPFKTSKGDRKIIVIFEDAEGREASQSFPIEGKAAFNLARLIKAASIDTAALKADGVEPAHFADRPLAEGVLVGKELWIEVEHSGQYANAEPVMESDLPVEVLKRASEPQPQQQPVGASSGAQKLDDSDIPF